MPHKLRHDYNPQSDSSGLKHRTAARPLNFVQGLKHKWSETPPAILALLGGLLLAMVAIIAWPGTASTGINHGNSDIVQLAATDTNTGGNNTPANKNPELRIELALPAPQNKSAVSDPSSTDTGIARELILTVKSGDTLGELFTKHNLSYSDMLLILADPVAKKHLTRIKPNEQLWVQTRPTDGDIQNLQNLTYNINQEKTLHIKRDPENSFVATLESSPLEKRVVYAHGIITDSLFLAGLEAGLEESLIMNLAGIYQWDIDFVKDIRKNDSFTLIYEEFWKNGERIRSGEILAAEFINAGEAFQAIRFTDDKNHSNYFTPDGKSLRKTFLRTPGNFLRVSSSFNMRRFHPVLKKVRPHRGVDYGAPTGTPIKAAGDGKVIHRGRKGGYGNTIILQHGGNITTLYAHMSKYAGSARVGRRVKQGQIIGYVGRTGLANGPHLHYEYRLNGAHRNPRTVKLPNASPLAKKHASEFEAVKLPLLAQLDVIKRANIVLAEKRRSASSSAVASTQ